MPQQSVGSDNVTGDRYTLDLGVEPDLGSLLQNLQVANDLLDQSEAKFRAISDAVGSTTQKLAQATRQAELFAAQSGRIQNSFQSINMSSGALAGIGAGAVGGVSAYGGMMPMPGMPAYSGMPGMMPAMAPPSPIASSARSDYTTGGELPSVMPPPAMPRQQFRGSGILAVNQLRDLAGHGRQMEASIANSRFANRLPSWLSKPLMPTPKMPFPPGIPEPPPGAIPAAGGIMDAVPKLAWPLLAAEGARKGYEAWRASVDEMTRMSGLTGGTGFISSGDGFGGSLVGLKSNAILQGFLHPEIGFGSMSRIQEQVSASGLRGGDYDSARNYLMETYKRGMGETVDQLDMFEEAVDKAGGSTAVLVGGIDKLRITARNTNANLTVLTQNMKANIESAVSFGMGGDTAAFAATLSAGSYAGSVNPAVRDSRGLDYMSDSVLRARVAASVGVSYGQLGNATVTNPSLGQRLPVIAEQEANKILVSMGFTPGMTISQLSRANSWGDYLGRILAGQGVLPPDIDPMDLNEVYGFIQQSLDNPVSTQYKADVAMVKGSKVGDINVTNPGNTILSGFLGTVPGVGLPLEFMSQSLGWGHNTQSVAPSDYVSGVLHGNDQDAVGRHYQDYINVSGGQTVPVLDALYNEAAISGRSDFMVKDPETGETMSVTDYIESHPDWTKTFRTEGALQYHTVSEEERTKLDSGELRPGDLAWANATAVVQGQDQEQVEEEKNDSDTVNISQYSVEMLGRVITNAFETFGPG